MIFSTCLLFLATTAIVSYGFPMEDKIPAEGIPVQAVLRARAVIMEKRAPLALSKPDTAAFRSHQSAQCLAIQDMTKEALQKQLKAIDHSNNLLSMPIEMSQVHLDKLTLSRSHEPQPENLEQSIEQAVKSSKKLVSRIDHMLSASPAVDACAVRAVKDAIADLKIVSKGSQHAAEQMNHVHAELKRMARKLEKRLMHSRRSLP